MLLCLLWPFAGACGGDSGPEPIAYEELCQDFVVPPRPDVSGCSDVDAANPDQLAACLRGSGEAGFWGIDGAGLPVYDLAVEHRCDPAGYIESPLEGQRIFPVHLIGNGRGLIAAAHASGEVELYSQDRGGKWLNKIDRWRDADDRGYPEQLGGGYSYIVLGDEVRSTRFDDLAVGSALVRQSRRFGPGYFETETKFDDLLITRRVFAPARDPRALIAEVTIDNLSDQIQEVGLVEMWDVNIHQLAGKIDPTGELDHESLRRARRAAMAGYQHTARYEPMQRVAVLDTASMDAPVGDRSEASELDHYIAPMYLAPIDVAGAPDAVWLSDDDLWSHPGDRQVPSGLAGGGNAEAREVSLDGADQEAVLAVRVTLQIPVEAPVTRRFAFGYVPEGRSVETDLEELRANHGELAVESETDWLDHMVWLAVPGADNAGALQREAAWASYMTRASAAFDESTGARVAGPGGADRYVWGHEGAAADLGLVAEALALIDPQLTRETLAYAFSMQSSKDSSRPGHFSPVTWGVGLAGTGVAEASPVDGRTDAYAILPSATARYISLMRDSSLLDEVVPFRPLAHSDEDTVLGHLERAIDYLETSLGTGGRGLLARGDWDIEDGSLGAEGESSTVNAAAAAAGFPLVVEALLADYPALAARFETVGDGQLGLLVDEAFNGSTFERGFAGDGSPIGPDLHFESQVLGLQAEVLGVAERDALLAQLGEQAPARLWAGAWWVTAQAQADRDLAWTRLWQTSLASRAEAGTESWYGVWTGPDDWDEADGPSAFARQLQPALSSQGHAATLRALAALAGFEAGSDWMRVSPRFPSETFSLIMPRFELRGTPTQLTGAVRAMSTGSVTFEVDLPAGLTTGELSLTVDGLAEEFTRTGDVVSFTLPLKRDAAVTWTISR